MGEISGVPVCSLLIPVAGTGFRAVLIRLISFNKLDRLGWEKRHVFDG